jgi:hypothetical protein
MLLLLFKTSLRKYVGSCPVSTSAISRPTVLRLMSAHPDSSSVVFPSTCYLLSKHSQSQGHGPHPLIRLAQDSVRLENITCATCHNSISSIITATTVKPAYVRFPRVRVFPFDTDTSCYNNIAQNMYFGPYHKLEIRVTYTLHNHIVFHFLTSPLFSITFLVFLCSVYN